jgi:hypothetical protein
VVFIAKQNALHQRSIKIHISSRNIILNSRVKRKCGETLMILGLEDAGPGVKQRGEWTTGSGLRHDG